MVKHSESSKLIVYILKFWWVNSVFLSLQDMFCLYTPGGGGYGREEEANRRPQSKRRRLNETFLERGSVFEYRMAQEGVWKEVKKKREGEFTDKPEGEKKERGGEITGTQSERWERQTEWGSLSKMKMIEEKTVVTTVSWLYCEKYRLMLKSRCRLATEMSHITITLAGHVTKY